MPAVQGSAVLPYGINERGEVAGTIYNVPADRKRAFLWSIGSGLTYLDPRALDSSGRIFGNFFTSELRGFRWQLRPDGASGPEFLSYDVEYPHSYVVAANDAGQVLGYDGVWRTGPGLVVVSRRRRCI